MVARSSDGGLTWSKTSFDKTLVEPQCQASIVRYSWPKASERGRILFSNPAGMSRKTMTVRMSYDEGKSWPISKLIYNKSSAYSCLATLPNGRIGIVYERDDYAKITFASFTLDWLTNENTQSTRNSAKSLQVHSNEFGVFITEGKSKVLYYQRVPKSLDGKYLRANYIHPLYDLDGNILTEDFPEDHKHHRGIFWAWHQLWVGDKKIGDGWACKDFGWHVHDVDIVQDEPERIKLQTQVHWTSPLWTDGGEQKLLVEENTVITVHKAKDDARAIDFDISLRALEKDMRIGGSDDVKGYGGFSTRVRLPEGTRFMGRDGEVEPKRTAVDAGPWIDLSARFGQDEKISGFTILCHSSSPDFPQRWILRRQKSMQNAAYPGREPIPLSTETPLVLRYRLIVHRSEASVSKINTWEKEYSEK